MIIQKRQLLILLFFYIFGNGSPHICNIIGQHKTQSTSLNLILSYFLTCIPNHDMIIWTSHEKVNFSIGGFLMVFSTCQSVPSVLSAIRSWSSGTWWHHAHPHTTHHGELLWLQIIFTRVYQSLVSSTSSAPTTLIMSNLPCPLQYTSVLLAAPWSMALSSWQSISSWISMLWHVWGIRSSHRRSRSRRYNGNVTYSPHIRLSVSQLQCWGTGNQSGWSGGTWPGSSGSSLVSVMYTWW